MQTSDIEWTDSTWNPVTGCTKVSQGCKHCYAESVAKRWWGDRKFTDVRCHEDRLKQPLHWRKPRRVFVNSMSDLFHEDVPDEFIDRVFGVMALAHRHTFQVLTKRPARMREYLTGETVPGGWTRSDRWSNAASKIRPDLAIERGCAPRALPNVWLGVSAEDQQTADERIPLLLDTPAAVRFVSAEPLLGPIDLWGARYPCPGGGRAGAMSAWRANGLDWVIVGGESGPSARPMDPAWVRSIRDDCQAAGVAFFFKQWGGRNKKSAGREIDGRTWDEMPGSAAKRNGATDA